ncbi:hypothetical protein PO909_012990 [Leuciscus waleckii]
MPGANAAVNSGAGGCRGPGQTSMRLQCATEAEIPNASRHQALEGTRTGQLRLTEFLAPGGHATLSGLLPGGGLNTETKARLPGDGPRGNFVEWVLWHNGSSFTVGPCDSNNESRPTESVLPESRPAEPALHASPFEPAFHVSPDQPACDASPGEPPEQELSIRPGSVTGIVWPKARKLVSNSADLTSKLIDPPLMSV